MIRLNVFIQVSAENRAAVLESAKELVAYSLKDNGALLMMCLRAPLAAMFL